MWVLGVETAGERGGAALVADDGSSFEAWFEAGRAHVELLPRAVDSVLGLAGIRPHELGLIAVDVGPGSFTGLRIGASFSEGLARALDVPAVGVRQAEAIGLPAARAWPGRVVVWIHDRRDIVYVSWISGDRAGREAVLGVEQALGKLAGRSGVWVVGSGAVMHAERLRALGPGVWTGGGGWAYPSPAEVARQGRARFDETGRGERGVIEPCYLQGP